mmetsp:Transcript_100920/g.281125  ORF Transcript_100920/g.281125 Transcript_100920/m.281125 type:complete len:232 (-) Transcript_100920:1283-1978(-)
MGRGQVHPVEKPLNPQPWQDGHHGQHGLEELEHLHRGEEVGVRERIQDSGGALHRYHACPTGGVPRRREVEVAPPWEAGVAVDGHKLSAPLRLKAAIQQLRDVSLRFVTVLVSFVHNPRQAGKVERPHGRMRRAPDHAADRVRLWARPAAVAAEPRETLPQLRQVGSEDLGRHDHHGRQAFPLWILPLLGSGVNEVCGDKHEKGQDQDVRGPEQLRVIRSQVPRASNYREH